MSDDRHPGQPDQDDREPSPAGTRGPSPWQVKLIVAAVAILAIVTLLWPSSGDRERRPGGFLVDGNGRPAPLAERLEPVTLVHFWATWCPPCLEEIPALQRLATDFSERRDFRVVLVAVEDSAAQVEDFLGEEAASGVLYDPSWQVAHRYGTRQLPETYLVVDGQVRRTFEGATDWDAPSVRRELERIVDRA